MTYKNVILVITLIGVALLVSCKKTDPTPAQITSIPQFIKDNPSRSSFILVKNDSVKIQLRQDQKFPLASTMKIIIAIEFANQVASGKVRADELIPVSDLNLYYLPNTDGGAHTAWQQNAQSRNVINNNRVTLQEVARGMVWFSSNANTEYLMDKLGLDNINANLTSLNLPKHDKIYYLVSAMAFCTPTAGTTLKQLSDLSLKAYIDNCAIIHNKLKADIDGSYKKQIVSPDLTFQQLWSDRLPASTTNEYVSVMQKILGQIYFSAPVRAQLDAIMQPFLEVSANRAIYSSFYNKGGSTTFVLTDAFASRQTTGNKTVGALFFGGLTPDEQSKLESFLNSFLIDCTQGDNYKRIIAGL